MPLSSVYSITTVADFGLPVSVTSDVVGVVPAFTSLTFTVTPSGSLSFGNAATTSSALALTASSKFSLPFRTVSPSGFTNGNTLTTAGTSTSSSVTPSFSTLATTVTFLSPGVVVSTGSL